LILGLAALAAAMASPALSQESPPRPSRTESRLRMEAWRTDGPHVTEGESWIALLGDAHIRFESETPRGTAPVTSADESMLDVRAENAVAFIPSSTDVDERGAPSVRAIYAEGHVRLEQRTGTATPFVLEADRLWIDLVSEHVYARKAVARVPGSPTTAPQVVAPNPIKGPVKQGSFTLRGERLRLDGTGLLEADDASVSICDFGLPHEALEAKKITIAETAPGARKKLPRAIGAAAALGGLGAVAIARKAERDLPFRAFRDLTRRRASPREGSDALFHAIRDSRTLEVEGAGVRVRPPFVGEEGFGFPLLVPLAWETELPFPDLRIGHSSKLGYFELAQVKVPLLRQDILHAGADGDSHVKEGLALDAIGGGGFYEERGGTGTGGADWEYRDDAGNRVFHGDLSGTYIHDRAEFDRNGVPVTDENRYWVHMLQQMDLPLGIKLDAEVSKQSDANYLLEFDRSAAFNQKEQESYVYVRDKWDDFGVDLTAKWKLNPFQSQTEELPRARAEWILTPIATSPTIGGLYFSLATEAAQYRTRLDDTILGVPDERLGRGDVDGRLDYKLSILDTAYFRAFGEGRYTVWTARTAPSGTSEESIDRFLGATGARIGSQADAIFPLTDTGLTLRHVIIPEVGVEDRALVTRDPSELIPIDEIETYRTGTFIFGRIRNRLQYADSPSGKKAQDLLDVSIEARYFPTSERLQQGQRVWGTALGDARLYLGAYGIVRSTAEIDPNVHRILKLEETFSLLATRGYQAWTREGATESRSPYPDISFDLSYREVFQVAKSIGWSFNVRLSPSWGVQVQELYDLEHHTFFQHRVIARRYFHNFVVEGAGSYNAILHETSFTVGVSPFVEGDEKDTLRPGIYDPAPGW
jgi:hypothetical protein